MGIDNNLFDKFAEEVCSQIKCTEVHKEIKEELTCHLQDIREEYIAQGSSFQEASKFAISHMGDSEKIGFDLNKIYKKTPEYKTLIICSLFIAFGLFIQFSIFKNAPEVRSYNSYIRMILFTILGGILGIATYFFDYRKLEKYSWHIFIGANIILIFPLLFGVSIYGMSRTHILGISFDINLSAVILYSISFSGLFPRLYSSKLGVLKILALIIFCGYLLTLGGNHVTLIIFFVLSIVQLIYTGLEKKYVFSLLGIVSAALAILLISSPYRLRRLLVFINFEQFKDDTGYINNIIYELMRASNIFGNGVSKEIISSTPVINQDLIYIYIIYTFGWIVGLTLFALVIFFIVNLFKTSTSIKSIYGKTLFKGISSIFAVEFLLSILTNLNLFPIVSISMPFLSNSGNASFINMFLVGLICSIYGRKNLSKSLVKASLQINN
ncbi:FtsW/RodA/SpoVE family cell cycle protein [Clostridium folliculivorans]|uniref:Cell division protein FtsW n=1 Tax=Clostridium folliculivorans TaxID=2886038 RepID=A0A9W5Y4R3_9CLOT|nr:FtsW/RodA/SpoVE family cell cycle protein [Clostridium folliculivorans]GKU26694.1 cell division protein FtsW [Clostridium folliculivorans]GKU28874.1 cell division protein FtsW [Clostridium folliculivorans]